MLGDASPGGDGVAQALAIPAWASTRAIFPLDSALIVLAAPAGDHTADSRLGQRLATRGEGPYAVALRVPEGTQPRVLDTNLTHGALLELVSY